MPVGAYQGFGKEAAAEKKAIASPGDFPELACQICVL